MEARRLLDGNGIVLDPDVASELDSLSARLSPDPHDATSACAAE